MVTSMTPFWVSPAWEADESELEEPLVVLAWQPARGAMATAPAMANIAALRTQLLLSFMVRNLSLPLSFARDAQFTHGFDDGRQGAEAGASGPYSAFSETFSRAARATSSRERLSVKILPWICRVNRGRTTTR